MRKLIQNYSSYNEGIMGNKTSKSLVLEDYNSEEFNKLAKYEKKIN